MEKMREEFEAWFWNEFHKDSDVELYWSSVFATTVNGDYRGMACYAYWTIMSMVCNVLFKWPYLLAENNLY